MDNDKAIMETKTKIRKYPKDEPDYQMLLENTDDVLYSTTPEGFLTYVSPQLVKYGYKPQELILKNFIEYVNPDQRSEVLRNFQRGTIAGESLPTKFQMINKDGTLTWVEAVGKTLYDESGKPMQQIGVLRDISYQTKIEEQLRQSEEKYRSLVEKISEVIYSINLQGEVTFISPSVEAFLGYSPDEVIGKRFTDFVAPEEFVRINKNFEEISAGKELKSQEYKALTKCGHIRWMRTSSSPKLEGGQVTSIQGVITDITDRKLAEEQLSQAAAIAERERLARELHDSVTQTLYSITAISEALPHIWDMNQEQALEGLQEINKLSNAALTEMRTLLLELRPGALEKQNLAELIHQIVIGLRGKSKIPVELEVVNYCSLPSDIQIKLYRITQESLNNIVKHSRAKHAQVCLDCKPDRVNLTISDDGVGFNPKSVKSHHLGLDIMRQRAEEIGAILKIESGPDTGTKILVEWKMN